MGQTDIFFNIVCFNKRASEQYRQMILERITSVQGESVGYENLLPRFSSEIDDKMIFCPVRTTRYRYNKTLRNIPVKWTDQYELYFQDGRKRFIRQAKNKIKQQGLKTMAEFARAILGGIE